MSSPLAALLHELALCESDTLSNGLPISQVASALNESIQRRAMENEAVTLIHHLASSQFLQNAHTDPAAAQQFCRDFRQAVTRLSFLQTAASSEDLRVAPSPIFVFEP